MSTTGLEGMTKEELKDLQTDVDKALREADHRDRIDLRKQFEELAAARGMTPEYVLGIVSPSGNQRPKAPVKYQDPQNPSNTWNGRGRRPHWFNARLDQGIEQSEMLIS